MPNTPFTILLVDDNEVIQAACGSHLESEGYRVLAAADGREALRKIEELAPDLVLLDVMMPGLNGFEVLEQIRREHPPDQLPVIMTTAKDQNRDVVRAFDLGANDYVTKPLDLPVLSVRIRAQLRGKRQALDGDRDARAAAKSLAVESGVVLDDKYLLEALISQGSYGIVYRARHVALDREVAVKLLGRDLKGGDRRLRRFRREGISACRVDHPNAVTVLDSSVTAAGVPFLVMELLRGHTLEEEIRRHGRLSPRRTGEIVLQVCDVLGEAHAVGIIHRDVKPSNIFLHRSRQGEIVKVLDFGIAHLVEEDAERTPESGVVGTPIYMAPERFSGKWRDGRTDVYSLGVVLYEMLAGELPFGSAGGNPIKVMLQQINDQPAPLLGVCPELDPAVAALVHEALAKDAAVRPTARQLGRRLATLLRLPVPPSLQESSAYEPLKVDGPGKDGPDV